MIQKELKFYPANPGYKKRGTSERAAREVKSRAVTLREQCLNVLRSHSLTADEIAFALGEDKLSIRPRITELLRQDKIKDTGVTRMNNSGKFATVWCIK